MGEEGFTFCLKPLEKIQVWKIIAKLVPITPFPMVYGIYNYSYWSLYINQQTSLDCDESWSGDYDDDNTCHKWDGRCRRHDGSLSIKDGELSMIF